MKIGDPTTPDEEIRDVPNRLRRLDAKFLACLTDILKGEMSREINLSIEETKKSEMRILKGAEIYRFIARYCRTQEGMGVAPNPNLLNPHFILLCLLEDSRKMKIKHKSQLIYPPPTCKSLLPNKSIP